jgi:cyclase
LIFLDISATPDGRGPDLQQIDDLADECFMPLTVGGGVRSIVDIHNLLSVGADKVAINSATVDFPDLVRQGAERFGSQCITASIDFRRHDNGRAEVFTRCGKHSTGLDPVQWAQRLAELGAGEILLTSIERDGTMKGYDLEIISKVAAAVRVPVIASGGAGTYEHMAEAVLSGHAAAVAAASIFHFTELTPNEAKLHLKSRGIAVRL